MFPLTCVVGRTDTSVVVDAVNAGGIVLAVVVFAVVRVHLAALALEARRAHAAEQQNDTMRLI